VKVIAKVGYTEDALVLLVQPSINLVSLTIVSVFILYCMSVNYSNEISKLSSIINDLKLR